MFDATASNLYDCKVMSDKLPNHIDPLLFAERRSVLSGTIDLVKFERLGDLITDCDAKVDVEVIFGKQGKRVWVSGRIKAFLSLRCQSCLQGLDWPLDLSFRLGVVASPQEIDQLEIDCEPLLFDGEKVSLYDLIEDEILLALPDYPKHEYDCIQQRISKDAKFDCQSQNNTNNPFSVLAKLKKTGE